MLRFIMSINDLFRFILTEKLKGRETSGIVLKNIYGEIRIKNIKTYHGDIHYLN